MTVELVIRYVNGLNDTTVVVENLEDILTGFLRCKIREMYPDLNRRRLRLLHNGRILQNHTNLTKELKYLGDEEVPKIYIHCIVGEEELSPSELEVEESGDRQPIKSTTEAPSGFDRLLSQGFSETDVNDLRRQFFRLHQNQLPVNANTEQIRELEDRWIDSSVNNQIDEFPTNLRLAGNQDNRDVRQQMIQRDTAVHKEMLIGVSVGFALGGLAVLLLLLDIGGVFNKRTKLAVVSGVIVNLSFGVLRTWGQ